MNPPFEVDFDGDEWTVRIVRNDGAEKTITDRMEADRLVNALADIESDLNENAISYEEYAEQYQQIVRAKFEERL